MNTSIRRQGVQSLTGTGFVVALLLPLSIAAARPDNAQAGHAVFSVEDASILEGNDGTQYAEVVITLSKANSKAVTVDYRTANGTASAGADYDADSGRVTFPKRQTRRTILIPVHGDRTGESDESFLIELSNPTKGIKIADNTGVVMIWDDEPRISIGYAYDYEGNTDTKPFTFTVSLAREYDEEVTVNFDTQDYSAVAGTDYVAASDTVTFAPGDTSETITVDVIGNTLPEPEKYFLVVLSNASPNAHITYDQGWGTISDDDGYYYNYGGGWWYGYGGGWGWGGWYGYWWY